MTGVRQMTYREYENAPGIRQSRLKEMGRSPAHFKAAFEDFEEEPTRAQIIGQIFHTAVLEPNLFLMSHYVRPETYTSNKTGDIRKWNANATECRDWLAAHEDRPVLFSTELDDIIGMKKSVLEHPEARRALSEGLPEQCLFVQDPDHGIGLKARADWLSGNAIVDLKTTIDASRDGFAKAVGDFGYHVQAAWYLDIANLLGLAKDYFVMIAVEKSAPYACAVHELDQDSIELGRQKYKRWLALLSHCMEFNEWPGYDTRINRIRVNDREFRKEAALLLEG